MEQLLGVAITDHKGRYIYVNKSWEDILGYKFSEVEGRYVNEIIPDTKVDEILITGEFITGHPIEIKNRNNLKAFSQYTPIFKGNKIVGVFAQVIMEGMEEALLFSDKVNRMSNKLEYYKEELRNVRGSKYTINNIIGESKATLDLKHKIKLAARTKSTVLIEGETGTGKELVAHSIHDLSSRRFEEFVKVNCAAIPKELLESEFFGYEEGAFTGAKDGGKIGKFELADKGSLFLDEINLLDATLQPKLLRVLQEKEIEPIGGNESREVDVRLIVATNKPLEELVKEKKFRQDLYYRLNVVRITVPPLRERIEDIELIFDDIVSNLNYELGMNVMDIDPLVYENLKHYNWPGNVRELQNVIERAMNLSYGTYLDWSHFEDYFKNKKGFSIRSHSENYSIEDSDIDIIKDRVEKELILDALEINDDNRTKTAEYLNISRTTLYNKMRRHGID